MKIRCLTINIAGVHFDWFDQRRAVLVNQLKQLALDIVFIQETTVIPKRQYDQTFEIAEALGLSCFIFSPYGNTEEFASPRLGGIGIVSRFPFLEVQHRKLPPESQDENGARVAVMARIEVNKRRLTIGTTHLSWRENEAKLRTSQVNEFLELLTFGGEADCIFGGDFNAVEKEVCIQEILKHFKDTFKSLHPDQKGFTWSDQNDFVRSRFNRRIDYIFCSENLTCRKSEVVLDQKEVAFPSDHFGVMSEFDIF